MSTANSNQELRMESQEELLELLRVRFEKNMNRHKTIKWDEVRERLERNSSLLWSIYEMERTGGEPDVIVFEEGKCFICDCSAESPKERRSLCYDREALESRKEHKPVDSALDMAATMGIEMLTEEQYRKLQEFGEFDLKTSSWVQTPSEVRKLGGALFCDRRYDRVFTYHNGAESYYAARGFRGMIRI